MGVWCKDHLPYSVQYIKKHGMVGPDFYEFGVYRGETAQITEKLFKQNNLPLRKGFGFDAFKGLPQEADGVPRFYVFQPGAFKDVYATNLFPLEKTVIINAWFKDLTDNLIVKEDMRSACFVHVDCDLYISALQALEFMFRNKLIVPGTVVAYDEFKSCEPMWNGGEAKAHLEICQKYLVEFEQIYNNIYYDTIDCWQTAFVVKSIGLIAQKGVCCNG